MQLQAMTTTLTPAGLLADLVFAHAGVEAGWVAGELDKLSRGASQRDLYMFLGLAPRRLGKMDLAVSAEDADTAQTLRRGWRLEGWSLDGAARVAALLEFRSERPFAETFRDLRRTADAAELVALYRGLPLYPAPEALHFEAGEGLRSNLKPVFEAIAHNNPFPREEFDEHRWNHMILKALFIGSALAPIQGLDDRANPELSRILVEYAHERWAAGRPVSAELWRCVGPFATGPVLDDLARALNGSRSESRAAALALAMSPDPDARRLLDARQESDAIASGALTWNTLETIA